jgi:hypothetical protein
MSLNNKKPINSSFGETGGKVIATALNTVPIVGGVLSDIANEIIAKRQNKRLNDFLISLSEKLHNVTEKINKEFIRTAKFEDLAEDIFSKAAETRQQEKLDALRSIFLNTLLSDRPDYDEAMEIAALIYQWQPRHIILLKILSDPKKADEEMGNVVGYGGGIATSINQILKKLLPEWNEDQIERTWQDLYDAKVHRTPGIKTMMTDLGIRQLENRLSDYGFRVASYIKDPISN